jgi:hypothetical protein
MDIYWTNKQDTVFKLIVNLKKRRQHFIKVVHREVLLIKFLTVEQGFQIKSFQA